VKGSGSLSWNGHRHQGVLSALGESYYRNTISNYMDHNVPVFKSFCPKLADGLEDAVQEK
jgi:hypothetical protein